MHYPAVTINLKELFTKPTSYIYGIAFLVLAIPLVTAIVWSDILGMAECWLRLCLDLELIGADLSFQSLFYAAGAS